MEDTERKAYKESGCSEKRIHIRHRHITKVSVRGCHQHNTNLTYGGLRSLNVELREPNGLFSL